MNCAVSFVNVQHGDCIVIRVDQPQGVFSILIDGGKPKHRAVDKLFDQDLLPKLNGKAQIDLLIASHHDLDHIGGLVDVVNDARFEIKQAWVPVVLKPNFDPRIDPLDETFTEAAIHSPDRALNEALSSMESGLNHTVTAHRDRGLTIHRSGLFGPVDIRIDIPGGLPTFSIEEFEPTAAREVDDDFLSRFPTVLRLVQTGLTIPGGDRMWA